MRDRRGLLSVFGFVGAAGLLSLTCVRAQAQGPADPYPQRAPLSQYMMDRDAEIALARTAAPASISGPAEVLVLGPGGYETAAKGSNGFVCLVYRSWTSPFADNNFWNPKERSPICVNPQGVRSVLPTFLERTKWALAGLSKEQIIARTRAARAAGRIRAPETGAMTFMMSKQGYLSDSAGGPWRPHVMFYMPHMKSADWGANLDGSPLQWDPNESADDPYEVFFLPVPRWSDGSPDAKA
jgi:hypothetical protein